MEVTEHISFFDYITHARTEHVLLSKRPQEQ